MCGACDVSIDRARADGFAGKMVGILNGGALAIMTSIGHRTGLFDAMAKMPPATSAEIAAAAGLDERYVREWLGAMVTGGIVECQPSTGSYHLPAEHAACLTRAATPNNIAAFAQYIPQLGTVEAPILACFEQGGGVPYSTFPRFQELMAEDSGQTVLPALLDAILPLVPGLIERLRSGIDVLDVGCGSGRALNLMARTFSNSRFTGYDFLEDGVARGRAEAAAHGTTNLSFEVKDAATIDEVERYDLITTFDAIHDQARPAVVLEALARACAPTAPT